MLVLAAAIVLSEGLCRAEETTFQVDELSNVGTRSEVLALGPAFDRVVDFLKDDRRGALQLNSIRRSGEPSKPFVVMRTNGDRIAAESVSLDDDVFQISAVPAAAVQSFSLPADEVRGFLLAAGGTVDNRDRLTALIESGRFKTDVLFLEGSDRLTGEVLKVGTEHIQLQSDAGRVDVATARARAVALNSELWSPPSSERCRVVMVTWSGTILSSTRCKANSQVVQLSWDPDSSLAVPMTAVRRMSLYGSDVTRASSLEPQSREFAPYLPGDGDAAEAVRTDRSIRGTMMSVGGRALAHGFGVLSGTTLRYEVPASASRFHADVGIDDTAGPVGSVIFRVELDGKTAYSSDVVQSGDAPKAIDLALGDSRTIALVADYGPDGDVNDLADWGEPLFYGTK